MLFDDETDPKTKKPKPRVLDTLSVPDLKEYAVQLKTELSRVEAEIEKKEKYKSAASGLFKA